MFGPNLSVTHIFEVDVTQREVILPLGVIWVAQAKSIGLESGSLVTAYAPFDIIQCLPKRNQGLRSRNYVLEQAVESVFDREIIVQYLGVLSNPRPHPFDCWERLAYHPYSQLRNAACAAHGARNTTLMQCEREGAKPNAKYAA